ncbi:hypothetical protein GCM10009674_21050 [Nesterenkonia xinjiangensis]
METSRSVETSVSSPAMTNSVSPMPNPPTLRASRASIVLLWLPWVAAGATGEAVELVVFVLVVFVDVTTSTVRLIASSSHPSVVPTPARGTLRR